MILIKLADTPIERYDDLDVKREDLSAPPGAPPFSKIRGLVRHLDKLKAQKYTGVAYVETSISMAGWGVAWACNKLGLKCLIFNPVYKTTPPLLEYHRQQWREWGAEMIDLPAGRAKVNYYTAKKMVPKGFKLLPLGLPLLETLSETYDVAQLCLNGYKSIVMCVGSGTIAGGVFQATTPGQTLYGVLCRSGSIATKRKHVEGDSIFPAINKGRLQLIDVGWEYTQHSSVEVPFPCHPYYDAKAWEWLVKNKEELAPPILFWNIGSTGDFDLSLLQNN